MERTAFFILVTIAAILYTASSKVLRQADSLRVRPAFSVGLTASVNFTQQANVIFDRIFVDTTTSYDATTGTYNVPASGDYVVMFHGLAEQYSPLSLKLYRNDEYLISAFSNRSIEYATASNVAVVPLKQGDTLHVQSKGSTALYAFSREVYSSFSGYLLYAHRGQGPTQL